MLFKLGNDSKFYVKDHYKSSVVIHYFSKLEGIDGNIIYATDDSIKIINNITKFIPSNEQSELLKTDYESWCNTFNQSINPEIIKSITNVEYNKSVIDSLIHEVFNNFEQLKCKDLHFKSSLGFKCDGDRASKDNIETLIRRFNDIAQEDTNKVAFMDYDNQVQLLDVSSLNTLYKELDINGASLYQLKWTLQSKLASATNLTELSKIQVVFPMMDFSIKKKK